VVGLGEVIGVSPGSERPAVTDDIVTSATPPMKPRLVNAVVGAVRCADGDGGATTTSRRDPLAS
jgi:hypothetical protein